MEYEAKFETKDIFFSSLSMYNIKTNKFFKKENENFQFDGNGGVPLAWREEDKMVFLDASDAHTLIIGSTGSKKSRLLVMPTVKILGNAGESIIITDPKAEIYNRTAADLFNKGYKITVINLRNPVEGNSWNPLEIPYRLYCDGYKDKAYEFVNDIATNLMLSEISIKDPYWDYVASDLFLGLTLLLFRLCKENNYPSEMVSVDNLLRLRRKAFNNRMEFRDFMRLPISRLIEDDGIIEGSLIGVIDNAEKTQKNITGMFDNKMRAFVIQPALSQMLSRSNSLLNSVGDQKTAIYLIMPDEKTSYHRLISIFIKQSYEYFIYQAQNNKNKMFPVRINYVLDEFSSLPTIQDFPAMISAARSRNIRFNLIVQSQHQLEQRYDKEAETIKSNCTNWIFLTSRELPLLQDISVLCGMRAGGSNPLITVSELQRFDKDKGEVLVLSKRNRPFKGYLPDIDHYDNNKFVELELPIQDLTPDDSMQKKFNAQIDSMFKSVADGSSYTWPQETKNVENHESFVGQSIDVPNTRESEEKVSPIPVQQPEFTIHTHTESTISIAIIKKYTYPNINGDEYEFALIRSDDKVFLSDQGKTMKKLDEIFVLNEQDVIKNLVAILKQYGVRKSDNEFVIDLTFSNEDIEFENNAELDEARYKLFACVSFMLNMKIFYV